MMPYHTHSIQYIKKIIYFCQIKPVWVHLFFFKLTNSPQLKQSRYWICSKTASFMFFNVITVHILACKQPVGVLSSWTFPRPKMFNSNFFIGCAKKLTYKKYYRWLKYFFFKMWLEIDSVLKFSFSLIIYLYSRYQIHVVFIINESWRKQIEC